MSLTDTKIKTVKALARPIKLSDGGGLYLLVSPSGSKAWRLAYRFNGKQKTLGFGLYPAVSLAGARDRRDGAKKLLAHGTDGVAGETDALSSEQVDGLDRNQFRARLASQVDEQREDELRA